MAHAINVIVSCTNRKRYEAAQGLTVRKISAPDLEARLHAWRQNLSRVDAPAYPASQVYLGDHWSIARSLADESKPAGLCVRLWVCSAGYGLISPETPIKSYKATFARSEQDYVGMGLTAGHDVSAVVRAWWRAVCSFREGYLAHQPRSIAELAHRHPRTSMLVVLSAEYLDAVIDDLSEVLSSPFFRDHLSIISSGYRAGDPLVRSNLLPCNAQSRHAVGGALTSLNIRLARWLLKRLDGRNPALALMRALCRTIPKRELPRYQRRRMSDEEIGEFIREQLACQPSVSHSALLRELRHRNRACERSRFARIFKQVSWSEQRNLYA